MTTRERTARRTARQARDARLQQAMAAAADERERFNAALRGGKVAILQTAFGPYQVDAVSADWWYTTHPAGQARSTFSARTFAGCNDDRWEDLLKQAGVARNPIWAR